MFPLVKYIISHKVFELQPNELVYVYTECLFEILYTQLQNSMSEANLVLMRSGL